MPQTKSQDRRLDVLNELFRSSKGYDIYELIDIVGARVIEYRSQSENVLNSKGISEKTIRNDIKYLREKYNAPIDCIDKKYKYTDANFTYRGVKIDDESIHYLNTAISIIQSIPGFELFDELRNVVSSLEMRTDTISHKKNIIQFDVRYNYEGNRYLKNLYDSIINENVIAFDYLPFGAQNSLRIVFHPYLLKEYNNRWYIIGWNEQASAIHSYGLERINSKIKIVADVNYYIYPDFDADNYYKNIIGISLYKDNPIEDVILSFAVERANYIETNPLHMSQKLIKSTISSKIFSYKLMLNKELESTILAYGEDVEVLKPIELRAKIIGKLEKSLKKYS